MVGCSKLPQRERWSPVSAHSLTGKKNMVYQAEVTTEDGRIEFYIGSTSQTFKGHRTDMNNSKYRDEGSKLSKFIWELKDEGTNYHRHMATLNKKSEIFSICRHRNLETLKNL